MTNDPMDVLSALLAGAVDILDIPDDIRDAAVTRYEHVGTHLATSGGPEWSIYPQGSFITGTVIRPPTSASEYDIDLVCHHDIEKESITQAVLKKQVGAMLEEYYDLCTSEASPYAPDDYFEKRRCWTLAYDGVGFHLDVLPAIPDLGLKRSRNGILLTDTKLRPWQHGNPKDYAIWFRNRSEEMRRKLELKARAANVAAVPDWAVRSTLQRLVQVLKWHAYLAFADDVDDRPPSVLVTTLAASAYRGGENLGHALLDVVERMPDHIDQVNGRWEVLNPAHEKENFCDKWNEPDTAHRRLKFMAWHKKVRRDVKLAHDTRDAGIDVLVDRLSASFGQEVLRKSAARWAATTTGLRDTGRLTIAASTGALGVGLGRRSPTHTFFGREDS
ncbi:nucleotidyltransferase [Lentzea alba]|uniref:nucleotidyltransferase domain-containing protein n=1 Tax=Lentzea alba TaxID=2714351 RepID=UPI0039BFAA9F